MPIKTQDAHEMLLANGWQWVKGGKGSYRKYKKNGQMFILPYRVNGQDISKKVEKSLKKVIGVK